MRYVRKPDVITAASKVTTRIRSHWRGDSSGRRLRLLGIALDGAGVKPAKGAADLHKSAQALWWLYLLH